MTATIDCETAADRITELDLMHGTCPESAHSIATHNGYITMVNPATGNHRSFRIRTQPADSKFAPSERVWIRVSFGNSRTNVLVGSESPELHRARQKT